MTSILSNIGVNFSRKTAKKATAATSAAAAGNGGGATGTYTPLGASPTTNGFFSSLTASNGTHNNPAECEQSGGNNFHISSLPLAFVGAFRGQATSSTSIVSRDRGPTDSHTLGAEESGDEVSASLSSSLAQCATQPAQFQYLQSCACVDRSHRYQECKSMVQLPHGFHRLEWIAYHGQSLSRIRHSLL